MRKSFARASYPGRPSPQGIEYSYHAAGAMARVRARAVHLHGINTLYHAVSVYTGMHKTLETLETLALRARVSKPVSMVLYIPVYTSTAWYNLYVYMWMYSTLSLAMDVHGHRACRPRHVSHSHLTLTSILLHLAA